MLQFPSARLMLFSKTPQVGKVKTRLIPHVGAVCAQQLHERMLSHQLSMVTQARLCPVQLWCNPNPEHAFFQECAREYNVELATQIGTDLGECMAYAFHQELEHHHPVVIIGGDCLSLTEQDLRNAFTALQSGAPVAIQPAEDGGYVLLGMQEYIPSIFEGIDWGTDAVFRQTRRILVENKIEFTELPVRWDVDTVDDVLRLSRQHHAMGINGKLAILLGEIDEMLLTSATL